MLWSVGNSNLVYSCAAYTSVIDILVVKAVIHDFTEIAQHFVLDLTCDVIGDPKVSEN